jgi:hypothetical protein
VFLASIAGHVPAMLWQQAISPLFTWLLRLRHAHAVIRAKEAGREPPPIVPPPGLGRWLRPWRCPRGTLPYDLCVAFHIAFFTALPWIAPWFHGAADPLGDWLGR